MVVIYSIRIQFILEIFQNLEFVIINFHSVMYIANGHNSALVPMQCSIYQSIFIICTTKWLIDARIFVIKTQFIITIREVSYYPAWGKGISVVIIIKSETPSISVIIKMKDPHSSTPSCTLVNYEASLTLLFILYCCLKMLCLLSYPNK